MPGDRSGVAGARLHSRRLWLLGAACHRSRGAAKRGAGGKRRRPAPWRPPGCEPAERARRALGRPQGGGLRGRRQGRRGEREGGRAPGDREEDRLRDRPLQLVGRHREPAPLSASQGPAAVDDFAGRDGGRGRDRPADEHADRSHRAALREGLGREARRHARGRHSQRRLHEGHGGAAAGGARAGRRVRDLDLGSGGD